MLPFLLLTILLAHAGRGLSQSANTSDLYASEVQSYSIASAGANDTARNAGIAANRIGYQYGPSPLGNSSYFPTGPLADRVVAAQVQNVLEEGAALGLLRQVDEQKATQACQKAGGLQNLSSYECLYVDQWLYTNPIGVDPGFFTNYTQDLYFSMERLSLNPYALVRLRPSQSLPFSVSNDTVNKLAGTSLAQLHQDGRLFLVDHSDLSSLPLGAGKYSAACRAYFYLHPGTDEFLPLAIQANTGASNLTYTPLDSKNDWMLAKTMFESNENFWIASYHVAVTHAVAEIVHEAALRTIADQHPVRGLLDRIMYRAYAVRSQGSTGLFKPGGNFDRSFAYGNEGFDIYSTYLYHNASAGRFQANYFNTFFVESGLVNSTFGPELPQFPFYEDVAAIHAVVEQFTASYVAAYYATDDDVANDPELQAWLREANGPAEVYDFPRSLTTRQGLVDILTQVSYLAGIVHHSINTGALAASWTLPLHPSAHWAPLPTSKGIDSVIQFLPNLTQSLSQIVVETQFSVVDLIYTNGTLFNLFADSDFLRASVPNVTTAANEYTADMAKIGVQFDQKRFDDQGLSQGMPFIYRNVNPLRIPFFLAV